MGGLDGQSVVATLNRISDGIESVGLFNSCKLPSSTTWGGDVSESMMGTVEYRLVMHVFNRKPPLKRFKQYYI